MNNELVLLHVLTVMQSKDKVTNPDDMYVTRTHELGHDVFQIQSQHVCVRDALYLC